MIKHPPIGNFKWLKPDTFTEESIKNIDICGKHGYLFEVDIHYPKELHKYHSDLPFLAESKIINKTKKLVTTCEDKKNYVVHITALQKALKHGLKLEKVHRVIQFDQKQWMSIYIMLNVNKRKNSRNYFEKNFFKLMIKSVFGKTMENVRNRRDIKLIPNNERSKKLVKEPNYHACKRFDDNFMTIEMRKTEVEMLKPVYVGQAILDISKTIMYEFWYDYLKPKYGDKTKLCYMDTDSFIIDIQKEDFLKDISKDVKRCFDTSGYDKNFDRPLEIGVNKKVLGKFKDELNGNILTEFISIGPKVYAINCEEYAFRNDNYKLQLMKKAKGTKKCIVKKHINFNDYMNALFGEKTIMKEQLRFKSDCHNIYTQRVNKIALRNVDNKRLQAYDKVTTYPYGTDPVIVCEQELLIRLKKKLIPLFIN